MQFERRALYNLMRMNWLADSSIAAEPWQVEDYRSLPIESIFERLNAHDIALNRHSFLVFAKEVDTPEELTDFLLDDTEADVVEHDQVYLLLFELWRRLVTDRPSLSIFCDELDHHIFLYDHGLAFQQEALQDVLANLQSILDENSDQGADPQEVFESVSANCANDLESFLYDYSLEQLHNANLAYAGELIEGFSPYVHDPKWFSLLRIELQACLEGQLPQQAVRQLIEQYATAGDLEFNLELLSFMAKDSRQDLFRLLLQKTLPEIKTEDELRSLLHSCIDFFHFRDLKTQEALLQKIINKRAVYLADHIVSPKDPSFVELINIFKEG